MKKVWGIVVLTALNAACTGSPAVTAPEPTSGRVELTTSPTAVSYAGGPGLGGAVCPRPYGSRWGPFTWTLRETNGLSATITSFTYKTFNMAGVEESSEEIVAGASTDFGGNSAPTLRVPANGTLTSRTQYDCELWSGSDTNGAPAFGGGRAVFTVSGKDDNGAAVSSTATLTLLPPP